MSRRVLMLGLLLAVLPAGCKDETRNETKDETASKAAATKTASKTSFPQQVSATLAEAGITPSAAFEQAAARPYAAKTCARGAVDKLDVLVCDFDGEEAAGKGEKKMEQFLDGAVSGGIRRKGNRVLAAADRDKVDLKGEALNTLLKAFTGE